MNWEKVIEELKRASSHHFNTSHVFKNEAYVNKYEILGLIFIGLAAALEAGLEPNKQSQDHSQHKPSE